MDKTVAIEVAKLRDLYQRGDKKTRAILEGMCSKEVLIQSGEELWEIVKNRLLNNEQPTKPEVEGAVEYVESLRNVECAKEKPWIVKDDSGKIIGVGVPIINKAFYFADVPDGDKNMSWDDAMAYAKKRGRTLASKAELMLCYYFKDAINAIAEEVGFHNFLDDWTWSSTEFGTSNACLVLFDSGDVGTSYKDNPNNVVRPVAAL